MSFFEYYESIGEWRDSDGVTRLLVNRNELRKIIAIQDKWLASK